ncbi:MAG: hypothetical protein HN350_11260 [Phycisphaerales bacterium]|jgi:hypothetical protein|nr:hypothetical protein [Phycisphaerales bacterium]
MIDQDTTNPDAQIDGTYAILPLWYSILVCLGSAWIGGFFGGSRGGWGILFGAVGGLVVAALWLNRVSKFRIRPRGVSVIGGILWGIIAGVIDTLWLHMSAQELGYHRLPSGKDAFLGHEAYIQVGLILGVIAGIIFGWICITVLNNLRLEPTQEER